MTYVIFQLQVLRYTLAKRRSFMDLLLAMFTGILCTIMIALNGELSLYMGIYASTIVIHLLGLVTIIFLCRYKKIHIPFRNQLPWYFYIGGVIGVFTVFFSSFTIQSLGASLVSVLGLLGQICTSLILEQKGWLGSIQCNITWQKVCSVCIMLVGIGVMLL